MKNILLILPVIALAACNTTVKGDTPDVTVRGDGYRVTVGDDDHYHGGKFCPPGQAKKGWCHND